MAQRSTRSGGGAAPPPSLLDLPDDAIVSCLRSLDEWDKLACAAVCRCLRDLVGASACLWESVTLLLDNLYSDGYNLYEKANGR